MGAKTKDLTKVVDAVEADLVELIKSARLEMLSKVHPGEDTPSEPSPDDSATSPGGPPPSPSPGPSADAGPPAGGPPAPDAGSPPAGGPGGDPAMDGGEGSAPSQDELVQAYASLPPDQLEAHFMAIQAVMSQKMGGGSPDGAMAGPPAGSPSPAPGPEAMKAEFQKASDLLSKAETAMKTRDSEIDRLRAEVQAATEKLTKNEEELTKASELVAGFLSAPQRRAITSVVEAPKAETVEDLDKTEIVSRLRKACRSNISAADRKAVDNYVCSGTGLDKVKHLIVGQA
jgi:hypothetical protein